MKRISYIILFILAVATFTSCKNEIIKFDNTKYFVAFLGDASAAEEGGPVGVPVMVAAELGSPSISVTYSVGSDVAGTPAVENEDYTILNSSSELSFSDGWGFDTIWIQPTDNDIFTGDKQLSLKLESNSLDYAFGSLSSAVVTIVDNEHPLKDWIGTYYVYAASYGSPGSWDEEWTVVTSPIPGDPSSLNFTGFGGGDLPVAVAFDLENMTITIPAGSSAGDAYGYGNMLMYVGDADLNLDKTANMVGTISADGSMNIDYLGMMIESGSYAGYVWDVFNTSWTLTKSARLDSPKALEESKLIRFRK